MYVSISQSRIFYFQDDLYDLRPPDDPNGFNLATENLLFSRECELVGLIVDAEFQSRNRESFIFKSGISTNLRKGFSEFQSRNRESFIFKTQRVQRKPLDCQPFQSRNRESFIFKDTNLI